MVKKTALEFKDFLREYKIFGLAIGFVIGLAANDLVKSLVNNIIMPLINPFIPKGGWETATLNLGPFAIAWGAFLSSLIYFVIIALIIFIVIKKILKLEKVGKR